MHIILRLLHLNAHFMRKLMKKADENLEIFEIPCYLVFRCFERLEEQAQRKLTLGTLSLKDI